MANQALIAVEDQVLNATNRTLAQYGLPSPDRGEPHITNRLIVRETSYNVAEMINLVETRRESLTAEQAQIADRILTSIQEGSGGLFFIDAPGELRCRVL